MAYQSPGGAFSNGLEDFMMKRAAAERQSMLDQRAYEYQQAELKQKDEALKRQREEADQRNDDRKLSAFEKRRGDLVAGDIPDDQLLKDADTLGQGHLFPVDDQTGHRVYMGAPKEREANKQKVKVQTIIDQLGSVDPGSADFVRLATQYEMETGRTIPGAAQKQAATDTQPIIRIAAPGKPASRFDTASQTWVPLTTDPPTHAHFVQDPQAPPVSQEDKGWEVKNIVDSKGNEILARVNKNTGEVKPIDNYMPLLPGNARTRKLSAGQVVSHFDDTINDIKEADNRGLLGPLQGRGAEFMAGRIGSTGNPENDALLNKLRMELLLVKSGTTMVHFGARGGQTYIEKMNGVLDSGKMSKEELIGALDGAAHWLNTYARDPRTPEELTNEQKTGTTPVPTNKPKKSADQLLNQYWK